MKFLRANIGCKQQKDAIAQIRSPKKKKDNKKDKPLFEKRFIFLYIENPRLGLWFRRGKSESGHKKSFCYKKRSGLATATKAKGGQKEMPNDLHSLTHTKWNCK